MTLIPEVRAEVHAAARRRASPAATGPSSRNRWRPTTGSLTVVASVLVVIAVVAVILLHTYPTHDKTASTVPAPRPAASSVNATLRSFDQILGVLRRPQRASDLDSPLLREPSKGSSGGLRPIRNDARRATITRSGQGVFIIPVRFGGSSGPVGHLRQLVGSAGVLLEGDGGESVFTVKEIESGQASFSAYSALPSQPTSPGPHQMFVLVPDGVSRVVVSGRGTSASRHISARVHGNVATFYTRHTIYPPRRMRWYTASGKIVHIPDHTAR